MKQDFLYDRDSRRWLRGINLENEVYIISPDEVDKGLKELSRYVDSGRFYISACIAYECGACFQGLRTIKSESVFPLIHYRIYQSYSAFPGIPEPKSDLPVFHWQPGISEEEYGDQFDSVRDFLEKGESYQINLTHPWISEENDLSPYFLFYKKAENSEPGYWVWWEDDDYELASFSPELFYAKRGNTIESAPMKGTGPRGRYGEEDERFKKRLASSEKERAENRMIADMVRNDLGKIAEPGSVRVCEPFKVESWGYVHQMITRIEAETKVSFYDIWKALFPCASITGAPKKHSMEIIDSIETFPRSFYTGSLGFVLPNGRSQFNVAIRTIIRDKVHKKIVYPVGSGIIWDSEKEREWKECAMKTGALRQIKKTPELLEAMLYDPSSGFYLEEYHYKRLKDSSEYWGIPFHRNIWDRTLKQVVDAGCDMPLKIRIILNPDGEITVEQEDLSLHAISGLLRLGISDFTLNSSDPFLFHKCSSGMVAIRKKILPRSNCDDVIFFNERGELCETTRANLVLEIEGKKLTPSLECGLLPGTFRQYLLDNGEIEEAVLTLDDLHRANDICLINSVRQWIPAEIIF